MKLKIYVSPRDVERFPELLERDDVEVVRELSLACGATEAELRAIETSSFPPHRHKVQELIDEIRRLRSVLAVDVPRPSTSAPTLNGCLVVDPESPER